MLRRPEWLDHPSSAIGLDGVTVAAAEPSALVPAYAALFGDSALQSGRGRLEVKVGPHTLRFLSPDRLSRRYPALGGASVMTVRCRDLEATRAFLTGRGIPLADAAGARLVIAPGHANGTVLEFVEG
jgi:hypothetical protein